MTGTSHTQVHDPRGTVHSGSGNVNHFHFGPTAAGERRFRSGAARLRIQQEYRSHLTRCFVPPRHYGRAADALGRAGAVVLLDGPAGIGRRTAATMLLRDVSVDGDSIEELPLSLSLHEETPETLPDDHYLLDLSNVADENYPAAERTLVHYRSSVERSGARMVAVLPAGLDWMRDPDLYPLVVHLGRPPARYVFSRHLRAQGLAFGPDELATDGLMRMFATAPMSELARLARLIAQARDSHRNGTSFAEWRDKALEAATEWSAEVAKQLTEHRSVPERSLLLAAAMAEGASADAVHRAAERLLDVLRYQREDTPGLGQADLGERLKALSVERGDDGRAGFARLAYGGAVRRHFWENFPDARPDFRDWVGRCVELPELRAEDRTRMVARFSERALAAGRPDDLCELVERWTRPSASGPFRAEATTALELGLIHERYGSYFRSRVYEWAWARKSSLAPDLVAALTDVCRQVIAVTHPEQAVVRLRHLAQRQTGPEAEAARAALLELARGSRRLFRRLSERLVRSASSPSSRPGPEPGQGLGSGSGPGPGSGPDILLELLDPVPLRITPPWQEFTRAWRSVMSTRPASAWEPTVRRWLTEHASRRVGARALKAVVDAAAGSSLWLSHLYTTACDWAERPDADASLETRARRDIRQRISERFCRNIDLVQGIEDMCSEPGAQGTRERE
ncbi:hypothetical protein ABT218_06995 [Streptomyces sp. NPDC001455]|uniref:hypothetical protein n=1 Tax=unclassified Streptomyces TaxID=2593676 RepID=UPI00331EEC34